MDEEYSNYMGDMGTDMGVQMDFDIKGWKRNYWDGPNKYLDYFSGAIGLAKKLELEASGGMPYYYLTRRGLDFLGRHIGVTIRAEER